MNRNVLLLPFLLSGWCALAQTGVTDCLPQHKQDSLVHAYARRAQRFGWEDARWDMTFDSLLAICPYISEVYQEKGFRQMAKGDFGKAITYMDKAVEINPKRWLAYRGYLHCMITKNHKQAIADLEAAEQLTPNAFTMDHTFSFFLALSHMELGNYPQAEKYFLKDIAQQKRGEGHNDIHFNTLFYFGILYYLMNEFNQAEMRLNECLQLYEMHPFANYYMGMTMKITGNKRQDLYFEKARQALQDDYALNEPNLRFARFPRLVTQEDIEKR
nr:tetratricopeptide repeat protein [uncultured Dyadobacter sp.]